MTEKGVKKAKKLPIEYKIDKELLRLLAEANEKYGEYKSLVNTLEFDSQFFLNSILLTESYKSTQIEGTQISQDKMYYLKYMEKTDDNREIQNLKKTIEYAHEEIKNGNSINLKLVNQMHKITLDSVRGAERSPVQMAMLDEQKPMLYLSEILELYKPSYQRNLMESRRGNIAGFIKKI